jgi:polysaccharide chain length determinant protein (PEP-CTERM system associated)
MNVEAGLQLSDLQGIVRRRAKLVLAVALLVSLAAYWLAMALPNEYQSYATVLVEPQSVDPDLVEAGVPESDLNRRLSLMAAQILSRPRLSRMIDEFDLYEEESNYLVRDEVIDLMRQQIRVEPVIPELEQQQGPYRAGFEIDQFKIFYRNASPVLARDVAQELANDFIEEHIASRVRVSQKSVEFIDAELGRLAEAIERVEGRVAEVKAANPGRLPEDMIANQRRLERVTAELGDVRREAAAARSDEAFYRSQSATARELMGTGNSAAVANTPAHRAQTVELALADYQARGFTEKHPDVVKAKTELQALRAQLELAEETGTPGSFAELNAGAEAERARLRQREAEQETKSLRQVAAAIQQLLNEAPQVAEQLDALERQYRHLFESFQDFSNRRLEAGVQADLERRQLGEQFRVLEAAFLAPEPVAPNRIVIIVIGIFFGFALGGGLGIVLEAADASVHEARQLQASLNIPVLASIPQIWFESDRLKQRRARLRTAAATVALVMFALVGGAANYWWVNGAPAGLSVAGSEQTAAPAAGGGAPGEQGAAKPEGE